MEWLFCVLLNKNLAMPDPLFSLQICWSMILPTVIISYFFTDFFAFLYFTVLNNTSPWTHHLDSSGCRLYNSPHPKSKDAQIGVTSILCYSQCPASSMCAPWICLHSQKHKRRSNAAPNLHPESALALCITALWKRP